MEREAPLPTPQAWTELLHAEVGYALSAEDIPVLHLKGPTVATWLYEPGERPSGDVDILVSASSLDEVLDVLAARGLVERYPGVNRRTTTDHAVTLARRDPDIGRDEVDVHDRFEGIGLDPDLAFAELWRRREPALLAHTPVWFPDLSSRALLVALNTARSSGSPKAREDLRRLLQVATQEDWDDVVALAGRLHALPALRAGLELAEEGAAIVAASGLARVAVTPEWQLRLTGAPRTAIRLEALRRIPWRKRLPVVVRLLVPAPGVLRMRDPRVGEGRAGLALGYLRRLGDGAAALPRSLRELRETKQMDRPPDRDPPPTR